MDPQAKAKGTKPVPKRKKNLDGKTRAENVYGGVKDSGRAAALTDKQITDLGMVLLNSTRNVYEQCRFKFKLEVGEEIFERLYKAAGMCRCDLCSVWKLKDRGNVSEDPKDGVSFVCTKCGDGHEDDDDFEDD